MNLIFNADDFGKTKPINQAVFELAKFGTLTSTTVMVNTPYAYEANLLNDIPNFSIGLHYNLTEGKPISDASKIPSLIDQNGQFFSYPQFILKLRKGKLRKSEMVIELQAQFDKLEEIIGKRPSHIDSHQNIHKQWGVAMALIEFSKTNPNLGLRSSRRYIVFSGAINKTVVGMGFLKKIIFIATNFYLSFLNHKLEKHFILPKGELHHNSLKKIGFLNWLIQTQSLPNSNYIFEAPCHPATNTEELQDTKLTEKRLLEYQIMRSNDFREALSKVTLTNFYNLKKQ